MRHRLPSVLPTLALVLALAAGDAAATELRALGHEFRPTLKERQGPDRCIRSEGITSRARFHCRDYNEEGGYCNGKGDIVAEWLDANGNVVAGPFPLNEEATSAHPRYICSHDGAMLVAFDHVLRVVERSGALGPLRSPCEDRCWGSDSAITAVRGGFLLAWPQWDSGVRARFLTHDGSARSDILELSTWDDDAFPEKVAAASDRDGRVVVAWKLRDGPARNEGIQAVLIEDGQAGEPVRLDEFKHIAWGEITARAEAPKRFLISWENHVQSGWVARRVSAEDDATTTTTTTLAPGVPQFVTAEKLDDVWTQENGNPSYAPVLAADATGTWLAAWSDVYPATWTDGLEFGTVLSTSPDDARRWSRPRPLQDSRFDDNGPVEIATDGAGVWIVAWPWQYDGVNFRRSQDGGRTWSATAPLYAGPVDFSRSHLSIAAGEKETFLAAWQEGCAVKVARSWDSGRTWQPPRRVDDLVCEDGDLRDVQIATDLRGNWLVVWSADEALGAWSQDNGRTWSAAVRLFSAGPRYLGELDAGADGSGSWLVAFVGWVRDIGDDWKSRVFVTKASKTAKEWSRPTALAPWHDDEGGQDTGPSVAAGGKGRWGVVWETHNDIGGTGLDSDIVASFSDDGGARWSSPSPVDAEARGDSRTDDAPRIAHSGADTWAVLWRTYEEPDVGNEDDRWDATIRLARTRGGCGNGRSDVAEECDDGNLADGDGCDGNCLATACGNEIRTSGEECDDGDDDETDDCLSTCRIATCGDGFTQAVVEQCDDGNDDTTDACPDTCTAAFCGDGRTWDGVEECDALDDDNNDGCLRDCRRAACGDGYLQIGREDCDDGNRDDGDGCSSRCRLDAACAASAHTRTATDALRVLQKAVGLAVRCSLKACDADGNGKLTAADALATLRIAVGLASGCGSTSSVLLRLESDELIGALQVLLDFRDAPGARLAFVDGYPDCTVLLPLVMSAFSGDNGTGNLRAGFISLQGFRGPADLIRCRLEAPVAPSANAFSVRIEDASTPRFDVIEPSPRVTAVGQ